MDAELLLERRSSGRRGRGRRRRPRGRGRRTARSAAPPRARSGRGRPSRPRRSARRGSGSRPCRAARGRRAGPSRGPASARRRRGRRRRRRRGRATGLWPPWRTSSAQILRGMSTSRPQPSPSPSTLPARWSIFCSDVERERRSARGSASRPGGPTRRSRRRPCPRRSAARRAAGRRAQGSSADALRDEFFNLTSGSAPSSSGRATGVDRRSRGL